MKLMLKHQQRNYFFYSFPHMSNFALLSFFLLFFLFFFLLGPDKPNITSSKGGRSLITACVFLHRTETFLWPFPLVKVLPERILGEVASTLAGGMSERKEERKGRKKRHPHIMQY